MDEADEVTLMEQLEEWVVDGLHEAQRGGNAVVVSAYRRALAYLSSTSALGPLSPAVLDAFPA